MVDRRSQVGRYFRLLATDFHIGRHDDLVGSLRFRVDSEDERSSVDKDENYYGAFYTNPPSQTKPKPDERSALWLWTRLKIGSDSMICFRDSTSCSVVGLVLLRKISEMIVGMVVLVLVLLIVDAVAVIELGAMVATTAAVMI